jgi:hypothetical protein
MPRYLIDVILGMSMKIFLGKTGILVGRLNKADGRPDAGGHHPVY